MTRALVLRPLDREALARLLGKYEELAALRRARARGEPVPERQVFKALAASFPGALQELDTLPLEVIDARAEALRGALAGGPREDWMAWMSGYHAFMRAALRIKIRVAKGRDCAEERALSLAEDASRHAGVAVDAAFVRAVAAPPAGRLANVVYARLEAEFGAAISEIRPALFPRRRA